jgi:hypothetical protein
MKLSQSEAMDAVLSAITVHLKKSTLAAVFFSMILMGCNGISLGSASATCETGTAQFQVLDGGIQRICGCAEGGGVFTTSSSFNCTVSVNTTLYFYFNTISTQHQVSIATYGLTPQFDASSTVKTAAMVMNRTGTFAITDVNSGIGGFVVVNP